MSALPLVEDILEFRHKWEDLWWAMSENDVLKYKEIKKFDVVTFYGVYDRWIEYLNKKIEQQRNL